MSSGAATARGTCLGFAIHSALEFAYLRDGTGNPLEVTELEDATALAAGAGEEIAAWPASTATPWAGRLHAVGDGYALWTEDQGWYAIDPTRRSIAIPAGIDPIAREERLWGIPAMLCLIAQGDVPLHAAAVEVDGRAAVIAAPSMGGKTTLSAAFVRAGHRLLSEDVTGIRPGPEPSVLPGPAMLRLRPGVAEGSPIPGARVVAEDARVHLALDPSTRGGGGPVPIGAVFLVRDREGVPRVERRPTAAAIPDLWSLTSRIPTTDGRARCFASLVDAVRDVPIWDVDRPLTTTDPATIVELIIRTMRRTPSA